MKRNNKNPLYVTWTNIRTRCNNPNVKNYKYYGGRGIKVCDRWNTIDEGFPNFVEDMGDKPFKKAQIDRIDNNGNYSPENCRWTDAFTNMRNIRTNAIHTIGGKTACLAEHAQDMGLNSRTLSKRIESGKSEAEIKYKGSLKAVLYTYDGKTMNISQWERHLGWKRDTLWARIRRNGMTIEEAITTPLHPRKRTNGDEAYNINVLED